MGPRTHEDIEIHEFRDSPPVSPQSVLHKFGYELRDVTNLQERPNSKRGLSFDSCAGPPRFSTDSTRSDPHPEISPEVVTSHARWTPGRPSPRNDLNSDNGVT